MTERPWTPGPWHTDKGVGAAINPIVYIEAGDASMATGNRYIAEVWPDTSHMAEDAANATLIAAAPELYEALAAITHAGTLNDQDVIDKMRAALAKANPVEVKP